MKQTLILYRIRFITITLALHTIIIQALPQHLTNPIVAWESGGPVTKPIPILYTPSNEEAISNLQPIFSWGAVLDNAHYELELIQLYPSTTTVYSVTGLTYKPLMPLSLTTYYWRVRTIGSDNTVFPWSEYRSMYIVSAVNAAPSLNFYTTDRPVLTWNRVTTATGYEIQVSTQSTFGLPYAFHDDTISADRLYAQTGFLSDGPYYWRVRTKDRTGTWGAWSAVEMFTIGRPAPTLTPTLVFIQMPLLTATRG